MDDRIKQKIKHAACQIIKIRRVLGGFVAVHAVQCNIVQYKACRQACFRASWHSKSQVPFRPFRPFRPYFTSVFVEPNKVFRFLLRNAYHVLYQQLKLLESKIYFSLQPRVFIGKEVYI
jgi:hypothetical protein